MSRAALIRLVLAGELRRLLRDRRAVLFGLVLPVVAFPLLFLFSGSLDDIGRRKLEARTVRVATDLAALEDDARERLSAALAEEDARIERVDVALDEVDADAARAVLAEHDAVLLAAARPPEEPGAPTRLVLYQGEADESAEEATARVRRAAGEVRRAVREERLVAAAGADPGLRYEPLPVDVARAEDAAGKRLGFFLPLLAVLVMISGGSFAALDAFCGERESGTLETLLVQPAPASAVAWGKYLAVLATGGAALVGNSASLFACLALGVGDLGLVSEGLDWAATGGRIALGCALFLPTVALVAAVLALIAARARSFGQGQLMTMPLTLLAMGLAAPAAQPTTELGYVFALVPITGAALALRDAAAGSFAALPMGLVVAASSAWAALALRGLATTLDAERVLRSEATSAEAAARRLAAGRAIKLGVLASFAVYVLGGWLQSRWPVGGLLATLWGIVLGLAWVAARGRRAGLGLFVPRWQHVVGALLCAPALAFVVRRLFELQQAVLPMPARVAEAAELVSLTGELSLPALVFVMAVSPGICEELLFRGALLGQMRRDLSPRAVVAWQALLFGVVHASVYRFLPTALVGGVLAVVTLRARGVVPAMVLHAGYNALLVVVAVGGVAWLGSGWWVVLAVPGVGLLGRRG